MECPTITLQKLHNELLKEYVKAGDVIQRLNSEIYTSRSEEDTKILKFKRGVMLDKQFQVRQGLEELEKKMSTLRAQRSACNC